MSCSVTPGKTNFSVHFISTFHPSAYINDGLSSESLQTLSLLPAANHSSGPGYLSDKHWHRQWAWRNYQPLSLRPNGFKTSTLLVWRKQLEEKFATWDKTDRLRNSFSFPLQRLRLIRLVILSAHYMGAASLKMFNSCLEWSLSYSCTASALTAVFLNPSS